MSSNPIQMRVPSSVRYPVITLLWVLILSLSGCVTSEQGGFKSGSTEQSVASKVTLAKQYLAAQDISSARRHLKAALEQSPNNPDAHDATALVFQSSGETQLAEKHFDRAVSESRGKSRYRMNYANFLFQQARYADAESQLKKVVGDSFYDRREAALVLLALSQKQLGEVDNSEKNLERALILGKNNLLTLAELAKINYGQNDYSDAWNYLMAYRQVAKQSGQRVPPAMLVLGANLASKLDKPDYQASFELALRSLYPDSPEYKHYIEAEQYH